MKRMGVFLCAALAAAILSQARADDKKDDKKADKDGAAVEAVKKADRALSEAILKGDGKAFDQGTADDYFMVSSRGRLWDKKRNLEALKSGTLTFEKIDDSDVKVNVYGDAAVVTGQSEIKGKSKEHEFDDSFRWTRVYVHREGNWLCVTEQLSRIQPPDEKDKDKAPPKDKDKAAPKDKDKEAKDRDR